MNDYSNGDNINLALEEDESNDDVDDVELAMAIEASIQTQTSHQQQEEEKIKNFKYEKQRAILESIETHQCHEWNHTMNSYATNYTVERTETRYQGSWDCPVCTFLNLPYHAICGTCQSEAPSHVLTFKPFPQDLRFGLEIEIIIPFGKRDGFTYESIASSLSDIIPEKVEFTGYTHKTSQHWKIVTDSSIKPNNHGTDNDLCFELVSPILVGDKEQGLGQLRNIMDAVRRIGIASNTSCGFHVHVDAEKGSSMLSSLNAIKAICQSFVSVENAFDVIVSDQTFDMYGRRTNRNRYCNSNRILFGQMSNKQRWNNIGSARSMKHLVDIMNPQNDRYRKLNLTNLIKHDRPSTLEFRHHGGVENLQEAEAWVRFVLRFCQNAVRRASDEICLLSEYASVADEIRALFTLVGCEGLEQFFTVDRKLFFESRIKNDWMCKVCKKKFSNSRSLSQHCISVRHGV
jgi:hypothetical protein